MPASTKIAGLTYYPKIRSHTSSRSLVDRSSAYTQASGAAVTTILRVMVDPAASGSTRVRAADLSLTFGEIAIDEDIEARLAALGYDQAVAQAVRQGDKRSFDEIARDPVQVAA